MAAWWRRWRERRANPVYVSVHGDGYSAPARATWRQRRALTKLALDG